MEEVGRHHISFFVQQVVIDKALPELMIVLSSRESLVEHFLNHSGVSGSSFHL
mgnify:CR=1 FL=1|jgi:hypothetical protein